MKRVQKLDSPQEFLAWIAQQALVQTPRYRDLQNPEKRALHQSLLQEQAWTCCYCGRKIEISDSHIEHFRPQHHYPNLDLEYKNLHASCIRQTDPGMPLHCGHAKENNFDEDLAIEPSNANCEDEFTYSLTGAINPKTDKADYMINLLNLNVDFLKNRRQQAFSGAFYELETLTNDEIARIQETYNEKDESGRAPEFGHAISQYAKQLLELLTPATIDT